MRTHSLINRWMTIHNSHLTSMQTFANNCPWCWLDFLSIYVFFFLFCKSNFSFASLCLHFYVFHEPEKKFTRCDNFNLFATIRSRQEEKHYFCCLFSIVLFRMCVKILIGHTFSLFFSPFNSTSIPQHENTHSWCHLPKWQKQNKTKAKKKILMHTALDIQYSKANWEFG